MRPRHRDVARARRRRPSRATRSPRSASSRRRSGRPRTRGRPPRPRPARRPGRPGVGRFLQGDYAPVVVLAVVMLALGAYVFSQNDRYLSPFNITSVHDVVRRARLHRARPDRRPAHRGASTCRSVRWPASSSSSASFFVNDDKSFAVMLLGFVLMARGGGGHRRSSTAPSSGTRSSPPSPPRWRRTSRCRASASCCATRPGGIIAVEVTGAHQDQDRPGPGDLHRCWSSSSCVDGVRAAHAHRGACGVRAVGSNEESARRVGVDVDRTVILGYVASVAVRLPAARSSCSPSSASATRPRASATR